MADEIIKKQITKEGYDELQNELSERKTKKRSEIAARIEDAKAQGDLSENSEYDEARAEQAENETRIEELEAILKAVEVVDDSNLSTDKVSLGSTVTLLQPEEGQDSFRLHTFRHHQVQDHQDREVILVPNSRKL